MTCFQPSSSPLAEIRTSSNRHIKTAPCTTATVLMLHDLSLHHRRQLDTARQPEGYVLPPSSDMGHNDLCESNHYRAWSRDTLQTTSPHPLCPAQFLIQPPQFNNHSSSVSNSDDIYSCPVKGIMRQRTGRPLFILDDARVQRNLRIRARGFPF